MLVLSSCDFDAGTREREILSEVMRVVGELGYSQANPKIASQYTPRLFTIKVNRGQEENLALALAFVRQVGGKKVSLCSLKTSGTIKSLMIYSKKLVGLENFSH